MGESAGGDVEGDGETIANDLASSGYQRTESECGGDCEGTLWYDDHTLVCDICSDTIDLDQRRRTTNVGDPWADYWDDRPTYENSDRVILPGGFLDPYDWASSEDVDGAVSDLTADTFYR